MQEEELFFVIIAMLIVTYIPRVLPMLISSKHYPNYLKESLEFLPAAIIAVIVLPDIFIKSYESYFLHPEFLTTILCVIIAMVSRNLIVTVIVSLTVLYLLNLI